MLCALLLLLSLLASSSSSPFASPLAVVFPQSRPLSDHSVEQRQQQQDVSDVLSPLCLRSLSPESESTTLSTSAASPLRPSVNSVAGQYSLIASLQRRGCSSPAASAGWYVAGYNHDGGLGAQLVMACFHIVEALRTNRSFAFRTPVIYAEQLCPAAADWSCFFDSPLPLTDCSVPVQAADGASVTVISGFPPVSTSFRWPHVGDVYLNAAALLYFFRPNERLTTHIQQVVYPQLEAANSGTASTTSSSTSSPSTWSRDSRECIAVHIRDGDKTVELQGTGRENHTLHAYAWHALRAIRSYAITDVLLLSDRIDAYSSIPALLNVPDVTGAHGPVTVRSLPVEWFGQPGTRNARLTLLPEEGLHLLAMWYAMARCRVIIGTYTSNIGRVLYEMALWWTPEGALPTFVDVNGDTWFMGAWRDNLKPKR